MKKLLALVAFFATTAFAQSNVTLSGNVDVGYRSVTQSGQKTAINTSATTADATNRKTTGVAGNGPEGWTSSQITLSVNENLGNGTKVGYTNETNLSSWGAGDDASNSTFGTIRQSFLSIGNTTGELRLGYQYSLEDQIQAGVGRVTPSGNTGGRVQAFSFASDPNRSALASGKVAREGYETYSSGHITRTNAFQYATPVMNGFQTLVQTGFTNDQLSQSDVSKGNDLRNRLTGIATKYSTGPLNLGGSYQVTRTEGATYGTANTNYDATTKAAQLAANYDFQVAKVFVNTFSRKTELSQGSAFTGNVDTNTWGWYKNGGNLKRTGTDVGVSVPYGKTTLFASVGTGKYDADQDGTSASTSKVRGYLLGATYELSKRTSINTYYTKTSLTSAGQVNDMDKKNIGFGLRHSF